ncbi:MAG TPA: pyocin knob domain-containing protein [Pedobacter sp.]|uniref:beta strand repeat-containing protein n=1 Tax=Pedobacter sp. TaxID=1411316 RepID=UPI002D15BBF9|nr:pyocin knob domain-containing protein [Pedobacter sp.]HMI02910.1 pyocin knob domain-containing protein [Pedobacter sp.]
MKRILLSLVAALALNTAYGQVKATSAELNAGTDDAKFATALALQGSKYLDQSGAKQAAVTTGTNNYTASITPAITAYAEGQVFYIKITTANTGASALNLNGLGYKILVKDGNLALVSGDLLAGKVYPVYYDGTNFQVLNAVASASNLTLSGNGSIGGGLGIGSVAYPHAGIFNTRNLSGAASGGLAYGFVNAGQIQSDVSVAATYNSTIGTTAAGTYTVPAIFHYYASQSAFGAGSTVNAQMGFVAESSLVGAANNYGFYGNIASGTNRYNFYANGTAWNYFNGDSGFGTNSPAGKVQVSTGHDAKKGLIIKGNSATQSANVFEVQNSAGAQQFAVGPTGSVALGGIPINPSVGFYNSRTIGGGTTAYGSLLAGAVGSEVTVQGYGFGTYIGTQAATFTLPNLNHFTAQQGVFGAGSTVTAQTGFWVPATLTGATSNYGFRGSIPSGGGRYNLFMDGTAQNYLAGPTSVGTGSALSAQLAVKPATDAIKGVVIQGFSATQSANLLEVQNSAGTAVAQITPAGNISAAGVTLTTAPVTSAGTYDVLTRNTTTGAIEKTTSGAFNQTLSLGTAPGNIILSGGNNVSLASLSTGAANTFLDANVIGNAGLFPNVQTTGSTNYPTATGGGIRFIRVNNTAVGYFEFNKPVTSADALHYRVGTGVSTLSTWQTIASREWAASQFQPLAPVANNKLLGRYAAGSGVAQDITLGSGLTLTSTGTLHSGYETGVNGSGTKMVKVSNPAGGQFKGTPATTGAIKIKLPSNAAAMYTIKGTLFQYDGINGNNRSTGFLITCYGSAMANGFSATFTGNNAPNYPVRWYTDGTTPAIYIGELTNTWSYAAVSIDEVQASFNGASIDLAAAGWAVTMETAFTGTLAATQLNTLPFGNLSQPLAGFTPGADNALSQSDTQIAAFGKIQGQLNAIRTVTGTAAAANVVYAGPVTGTATPTFRKLQRSDIEEAFGAATTSGVLDWNDISNTQPGFSPTLITGASINGPGGSTYYHPFTMEHSSKTGSGNLTQIGYPYNPSAADGITWRWRYNNTWSTWRKVWDSSNFTNLNQLATRNFSDLQGKPTTLAGYGIIDAGTLTTISATNGTGQTWSISNAGTTPVISLSLTKAAVGLGSVDNTPDASKPVSTATQTAINTANNTAVHKDGNLTETVTGSKTFSSAVGIGIPPGTVPSAYKLAVGGGIIAESVKVKPYAEWPDYVFEEAYPMLSLGDLEKFILKNKHLPDVPAAADVKKEGLDLGEMNVKLLQKIEELTLYLIEKDKEIKKLAEMVGKLNEDIKTIKK